MCSTTRLRTHSNCRCDDGAARRAARPRSKPTSPPATRLKRPRTDRNPEGAGARPSRPPSVFRRVPLPDVGATCASRSTPGFYPRGLEVLDSPGHQTAGVRPDERITYADARDRRHIARVVLREMPKRFYEIVFSVTVPRPKNSGNGCHPTSSLWAALASRQRQFVLRGKFSPAMACGRFLVLLSRAGRARNDANRATRGAVRCSLRREREVTRSPARPGSLSRRFPVTDKPRMSLARETVLRYARISEERVRGTSDQIVEAELRTWFAQRRFLDKPNFLKLGRWKSPRPIKSYEQNAAQDIEGITRAAIASMDEREKMDLLLQLHGVRYRVASTILHFAHPDRYMTLDVRALWSLGWDDRLDSPQLWFDYTDRVRVLARTLDVPLRTLDRALWEFSKINQPPPSKINQPPPAREGESLLRGPLHDRRPDGRCAGCGEPFPCAPGIAIFESVKREFEHPSPPPEPVFDQYSHTVKIEWSIEHMASWISRQELLHRAELQFPETPRKMLEGSIGQDWTDCTHPEYGARFHRRELRGVERLNRGVRERRLIPL